MTGIATVLLSMAASGAAYALSGGTYSSPQQNCNWTDSDWNTPVYTAYPGCHNAQLSLESGGVTDGNPNNGYNNSPRPGEHGAQNIRWVQFGINQSPNDPDSKGTGTLYSVGYPGQSGAPHAGCLAVNTAGTPEKAPPGSKPQSTAKSNSQNGCGNNKKGLGTALNFDYYQFYCPVAAAIPMFPYPCADIPGGQVGKSHLDLDTGLEQNLTKIATQGFMLYYGMDDNSDNGEHDGEGPLTSPKTQGAINGPSDGGGIMLAFTPQRLAQSGTLSQPEGLVNFSTGFCADTICAAATTEKQTAYEGCDANTGEKRSTVRCKANRRHSERNAYDYTGKKWDPESCNGGGEQDEDEKQPDAPASCNTSKKNASPSGTKNPHGGMNYWRRQEAHKVTNQPGFQFFGDPDAMGSPAVPIYPLPAVYVGTCGITLGGGGVPMPDTPITNKAHQIQIKTGC